MTTRPDIVDLSRIDSMPVLWPARQGLFWAALGRLSVTAVAAAVVCVSAWLTPSPDGIGTHVQTGMPPCVFHALTGLPCPSCGMTTAFARMAHLDVLGAFDAQPFGAALFLGVVAAGVVSLYCAIFNVSLLAIASRVFTARTGLLIGAAFLGAWVFELIKALA